MKYQKIKKLLILSVFVFSSVTVTPFLTNAEEIATVIYPRFQSNKDTRDLDAVELLETALQKTLEQYGPFVCKPSELSMKEERYRNQVKEGKWVNVIWSSVTKELEDELIPIRIPIRKGLLGYRIFLINKNNKNKFAAIQNIEELKQLSLIQGRDWNDIKIFRQMGFYVMPISSYENMFKLINSGRYDYFSRGAYEALTEYEARHEELPNLFVEEKLLLFYPWPKYFFVSRKFPKLAERIEAGLNIMIQDGSFDEIFKKYHQHTIQKANLKNRKLFKIKNPLLPETAPVSRKELWFNPFDS
ncbi:MAG: transporter substrate-binding domain-containing protein [Deltaproteobacteria bacterium]|nr:transporter substrate-binding domain-containing protein [Deltaproteobacteria bacterium]